MLVAGRARDTNTIRQQVQMRVTVANLQQLPRVIFLGVSPSTLNTGLGLCPTSPGLEGAGCPRLAEGVHTKHARDMQFRAAKDLEPKGLGEALASHCILKLSPGRNLHQP